MESSLAAQARPTSGAHRSPSPVGRSLTSFAGSGATFFRPAVNTTYFFKVGSQQPPAGCSRRPAPRRRRQRAALASAHGQPPAELAPTRCFQRQSRLCRRRCLAALEPHTGCAPARAQAHDFSALSQLNISVEAVPLGSFPNPKKINSLPFTGTAGVSCATGLSAAGPVDVGRAKPGAPPAAGQHQDAAARDLRAGQVGQPGGPHDAGQPASPPGLWQGHACAAGSVALPARQAPGLGCVVLGQKPVPSITVPCSAGVGPRMPSRRHPAGCATKRPASPAPRRPAPSRTI